jgi:hypothetical protein
MVLLEALGFWSEALVSSNAMVTRCHVISPPMQESLPKCTGQALKRVSKYEISDGRSYPSLDAVLER